MVQCDEHQHGARLRVGGNIRQRIRLAKSFVAGRADAAGDVHLPLDDIGPHPACRVDVGRKPRQYAHVNERHHQRRAVHGVTDGFALLQHRFVRLIVPAPVHGVVQPADIEVVLRQIEVLLVVCSAIQLHAVDRVALASGKWRVVCDELAVQPFCGCRRL